MSCSIYLKPLRIAVCRFENPSGFRHGNGRIAVSMGHKHGLSQLGNRMLRGNLIEPKTDNPFHIEVHAANQALGKIQRFQIPVHDIFGMRKGRKTDNRINGI